MVLRRGVAVLSMVAAAVLAHAQEAAVERLECLGSALRTGPGWTAGYRQAYTPPGMSLGEEAEGTVWVAWPDRALFRAGRPATRIMGLEGRRLRLVDLEVPSCDDHRLDDAEWERIPLAAVLDPRGAVDRFTVTAGEHGELTLLPHEPGGVDRVVIELDESCLPREVLVVDPQGATNRLVFDGWQASDGPEGGSWLPSPPQGLECSQDP